MLKPVSEAKASHVDSYGLTMMSKKYSDGVMFGHLGNAAPYGAGVFCDIKKGYGAIVLMNTFRSEARTKIPEMILNLLK